jgi:hypothetical protein
MIGYIITFAITSVFLYKMDIHNKLYSTCDRKYKKWKKITNLVSTTHKSQLSIYSVSIQMIFKALYLSFIQYLNNSVKRIDKNTYEVEYVINGKLYKMIVIPKKGPMSFIEIRDENDIDMTEFILPYYGPNYDWHSIGIIPQFFKCKKLTFEMDDGTQKVFEELDYIELNN